MKIIELKKVPKNKIGKLNKNGVKLEPHENKTAKLLILYGFSIEAVRPTNTPNANNPDIFMTGTIWEMKAPHKYNEQTLKNRMKKAAKQAGRAVFDLRNLTKDKTKTKRTVIKLFVGNSDMRRMIIIEDDERVLDFLK